MQKYYLTQIITGDKFIHQGIYFDPVNPGKKAILWVHGLSGAFYGNVSLFEKFANRCGQFGIGFAAFNGRGSGLISGLRKLNKHNPKGYDHTIGGAGFEDIAASRLDIDAGVSFLADQGYKHIILIGHSTGANKVCLWASKPSDSRVAGVVLAAPMSDRLDKELDSSQMQKNLQKMRYLDKSGQGQKLQVGLHFFPITPRRYLSLFMPHSLEDVFDYGDRKPRLTAFGKIKLPMLVVLSEKDEYQDRPIAEIKKVFDAYAGSTNYQSIILVGALHGYQNKESEFVQVIISWINRL